MREDPPCTSQKSWYRAKLRTFAGAKSMWMLQDAYQSISPADPQTIGLGRPLATCLKPSPSSKRYTTDPYCYDQAVYLTYSQYLDKRVEVQLNGSRKVMGTLRGYDVSRIHHSISHQQTLTWTAGLSQHCARRSDRKQAKRRESQARHVRDSRQFSSDDGGAG